MKIDDIGSRIEDYLMKDKASKNHTVISQEAIELMKKDLEKIGAGTLAPLEPVFPTARRISTQSPNKSNWGAFTGSTADGYAAATKSKANVYYYGNTINIVNDQGHVAMSFDLTTGKMTFQQNGHISELAKIFWEHVALSNHGLVPRNALEEQEKKNIMLEEELKKKTDLLNKALQELAKAYSKGD